MDRDGLDHLDKPNERSCPQPFSYLNVIPSDRLIILEHSGAKRNEGSHPSHSFDSYHSST